MKRLEIIPNYNEIEQSVALAKQYDCAFEFNDFYFPEVLDDRKRQEQIINHYAKYHPNFSEDTIHGAFLDIVVHSADSAIRDISKKRVRQSMEIAKQMQVRGVVFHTGRLANFRQEAYLSNWIQKNSIFFRQIAAEFPEQDIYMENMFDEAPDMLARLAECMKDAPNFAVCLDYAHAALTPHDQEEWVRQLAPYIRHMHLNDNDLKDDLHQAVGDGKINWKAFQSYVNQYHLQSSVLVEVNDIKKQRQSLEYMKENRIYPFG